MKVGSDISFNTKIYKPELDEIKIFYPDDITKKSTESAFEVNVKIGYRTLVCPIDKSVLIDEYKNNYYLSLSEAQLEQRRLREQHVNKLNNELTKAQVAYNDAIVNYLNKPLSNPNK